MKMPRPVNTKLLNWRTSQVLPPAGGGIVTAEAGRLVFTGDWCFESSFEGCNLAAEAAAKAAVDAISTLHVRGQGGHAVAQQLDTKLCRAAAATAATPSRAGRDDGAESTRTCSGPCGAGLPRSAYSKTQWSKPNG